MRARVVGVAGREVNLENYEDVRGRGSLGREYTITYRAALEPNEKVVVGAMWEPTPSDDAEVSVEQFISEQFKINIGDTIRFDILGRVVAAQGHQRPRWSSGPTAAPAASCSCSGRA